MSVLNNPTISTQTKYIFISSILVGIAFFLLYTSIGILDFFDTNRYSDYMSSGDYTNFEYPSGFALILVLISIFTSFLQSSFINIISLEIIFIISNAITNICIYLIGIKLYGERQSREIIYWIIIPSFASMYFVLSKFDSIPVCLMMLSLVFTLYGDKKSGYLLCILGFCTKIFPILILPLLIIYNSSKQSTLKDEIIFSFKELCVTTIGFILISLILAKLNFHNAISPYLFVMGNNLSVYANTLMYQISNIYPIPIWIIAGLFFLLTISIILFTYIKFLYNISNKNLIVYSLIILLTVIIFSKFHSPQYLIWVTPLLALISTSIWDTIKYYIVQILLIIEFPLLFGIAYNNVSYINPFLAIIFFGIEYGFLIMLVSLLIKKYCT